MGLLHDSGCNQRRESCKLRAACQALHLPVHLLLRVGPGSAFSCTTSDGIAPMCCLATRLAPLHTKTARHEGRCCPCSICAPRHVSCRNRAVSVRKALQGASQWVLSAHLAGEHAAVKHKTLHVVGREGALSSQAGERAVQSWLDTTCAPEEGTACSVSGEAAAHLVLLALARCRPARAAFVCKRHTPKGCSSVELQSWSSRSAAHAAPCQAGSSPANPRTHPYHGRGLAALPPAP